MDKNNRNEILHPNELYDPGMEEPEHKRSPLWYIVALFLALIIILMIIPSYGVKLDPEPSKIPSIDEVYTAPNGTINNTRHKVVSHKDFNAFLYPDEPVIKQTAVKIATYGCGDSDVCQAKAIFYFVRDNFAYVSETDDYIETAEEVLATKGSDCDGASVLLANLLQGIGIPTRFVFVPRHVFVQAYIPEAHKKYLSDGWVSLDATCRYCKFGEYPVKYKEIYKEYI